MKTEHDGTKQFDSSGSSISMLLMLLSALLLIGYATLRHTRSYTVQPSTAQEAKNRLYDPILLPITAAEVEDGLARNSGDAMMEYQLLLRSGYHHQEKAAYKAMQELSQKQPNNAVVLAGYFMATKMAEGGACTVIYNGGSQALPLNRAADDDAQEALQKAYNLAPKLWMSYAVDGADQFYGPTMSNRVTSSEQGIVLLRKAEGLAPKVPYVHWLVANTYTGEPVSKQKYRAAAVECEKALSSGAKVSAAAFTLFEIYSLMIPDPIKGKEWKQKYLALVPPGTKINPGAKKLLDMYP